MNTNSSKKDLIEHIKQYAPYDNTEKIEKNRFLNFLENNQNVYSRQNLTGHLTASSWIVNQDFSQALLIHHNIYNCWAPLGGHADNHTNLPEVAIQEAKEESGLNELTLINDDILDLSVMLVQPHQKRGKHVPLHLHFDIRYLLQADNNQPLKIAEKEVSAVKWFSTDEITKLDIDIMPVVKRVIKKSLANKYRKLSNPSPKHSLKR